MEGGVDFISCLKNILKKNKTLTEKQLSSNTRLSIFVVIAGR